MFAPAIHAQTQVVGTVRRLDPNELAGDRLRAIVPHIATIALADTNEFVMHIGDTLSLADLYLIARDSTGADLGRFRIFDSTLQPKGGLTGSGPRRYVAVAEGESNFVLSFPKVMWAVRPDDALSVPLHIAIVK